MSKLHKKRRKKNKMSTPTYTLGLGRDARLFQGETAIGLGKNISVKASAESIKVYTMDSLSPAVTGAGKQSFSWSAERLFTGPEYIKLLLAGTKFDLVFAPDGAVDGDFIETWKNCTILNRECKAGESDGLMENISGEAESIEFPAAT
jgi:hypothetical protein